MKLKAIIFSTIISVSILALSSCTIIASTETSSVETEATTAQKTETTASISETIDTTSQNSASDLIKVTIPQPNQIVEDPFIVEGEAHGSWYFEGVFPFMLQDANGTVIIRYFAQAQGESMVDDFVPFRAEIGFEKNPGTETGVLILEKENPSALPEYDTSIEIPVRFNIQSGDN